MQPSTPRIGYLVKVFPKVSETFILQEVLDLEALGVNLSIFALERPSDVVTHDMVAHVHASVTYLPHGLGTLQDNPLLTHLRLFARSPRRYVSTIHFWRHSADRPSWSKFLQAGSLAAALIDQGITHLHVHFANAPTSVAELAHRMTGIPYSMTCHAKDIFLTPSATLRRKLHHAAFVVTCTEHNRHYLQQISTEATALHRLYHGLNLARFDALQQKSVSERSTLPTIISVARFREKKGLLTLIRACHVLHVRGYRFRCCIVGFGPLQTEMEALIRELALADVIVLFGQQPLETVVGLYQRADIFALPCQVAQDGDRDGIPNVLMEAMACRLPVVTTAVSGISELVQHDHNGLLVPQQDPEALALALGHLLDHPAIRQRLGQAGRETIEQQFSSRDTSHRLKTLLLTNTARINPAPVHGVEPLSYPAQQHAVAPPSNGRTTGHIAYIVKGFPRRSEAFITNEIVLLEQMGLRLHLFSAFQGDKACAAPGTHVVTSPLTYLPEDQEHTDSGFLRWLFANLRRYLPSHLRLIRTTPHQYLCAAHEAWRLSWSCRTSSLAWPKKVFYKDFLRAGFIAAHIIELGTIRHLHAHFCHGATTMAMFAGMLSELPFSFTAHAKDIYLPKLNPGNLLQLKLRRARFVVTCTGANHRYLSEMEPQGTPIHTIYHGVDIGRFAPLPHQPTPTVPTLLSVGRFVEKKGFPYLIEACRIIKEHGIPFRCRIVGEPDEQTAVVQELIRRYALETHISIEPGVSQTELRDIYRRATVFVLPCHIVDNGDRDGIPNVLAEAMASGLPVISTTVSGIPELIEHRRTGLLVEPRNPVSLAKAIEELLGDPLLRHHLADAGRDAIGRMFDSATTTRRLFDLFHTDVCGSTVQKREETHAPRC